MKQITASGQNAVDVASRVARVWFAKWAERCKQLHHVVGGEQGSELIEIALVLPLYFMLVFGLTSFAIVIFAYCNASFAAKEAVRYAVVHSTGTMYPCSATDIQNVVAPFLWGAPAGGVTITPTWNSGNTIGNPVIVTVTLTYSTGLPYASLSGLVVSASSQGTIMH